MEVVQTGYSRTLHYEDAPIDLIFDAHPQNVSEKDGKQYVQLVIPDNLHSVFTDIDEYIRNVQCPLEFSPWLRGAQTLVCKVNASCRMSCRMSEDVPDKIQVNIRLGSFSRNGYCWLLTAWSPSKPIANLPPSVANLPPSVANLPPSPSE